MRIKVYITALIGCLLTAGSAQALMIDFRTNDWSGADGANPYSVGDITVTASANNVLYQDSIDGLGVRGGSQNDEIDGLESLTVEFQFEVELWDVLITDLFPSDDGDGVSYGEFGTVSLFDSDDLLLASFDFYGMNSVGDNGEQIVSFDDVYTVSFLQFRTLNNANSEFSVAGFNEVPEPATLILFGVGLAGLAGLKARKKNTKV